MVVVGVGFFCCFVMFFVVYLDLVNGLECCYGFGVSFVVEMIGDCNIWEDRLLVVEFCK